jgi:hypothetical protein
MKAKELLDALKEKAEKASEAAGKVSQFIERIF